MRKRFLSTVLVLIMLLSLAPMSALADDTFRSGDFTFVIETGVACVKKYNGSSSSVSVPSKVDYDGVTYKVRNIHQDALKTAPLFKSSSCLKLSTASESRRLPIAQA